MKVDFASSGESSENDMELFECISPTTRKPIDLKCRLRNLFFIRFDSSGHQPTIHFPKTLWGLGLQSFSAMLFSQNWWTKQIEIEVLFCYTHYIVLC